MEFKETGLPEKDVYKDAFTFGTQIYKKLNYDQETADHIYKSVVFPSLKLLEEFCPDASEALVTATLLGPLAAEYVTDQGTGYYFQFGEEVMGIISTISTRSLPSPYRNDCTEKDKRLYMVVNLLSAIDHMAIPRIEQGYIEAEEIAALHDDMRQAYDLFKDVDDKLEARLEKSMERLARYVDLDEKLEASRRHQWAASPKM